MIPVATLGQDLLNAIFLSEALHALDELDLHAFLGCQTLGVRPNGLAERQRELLGVIEQPDASAIEFGGHRLGIGDAGQRPLKHQPVETGQHADDSVYDARSDSSSPTILPSVKTG
jgi:hypothetical protein